MQGHPETLAKAFARSRSRAIPALPARRARRIITGTSAIACPLHLSFVLSVGGARSARHFRRLRA
eukprot:677547-Pyramimonas_sp.AAC.1